MEGFPNPYIDKLVGSPSEPEIEKQWQGEIIDLIENIGAEEVEGFEVSKTERDMEIITFVEKAVDEIMFKYGRSKRVEIPINNIHILKEGGTKEYTKGNLVRGGCSTTQKSLIVDRVSSDSEFATILFHEMVHLKSYSALQIVDGEDGKEIETYRSGITVVSRDNTKKYLESIEEAIVGYLTGIFRDSYVKNAKEFKNESTAGYDELYKNEVSRQNESENLNVIVDMIFAKNRHQFSNREEIFNLFIDAQINGNLLPVGKLIEKTFGQGTLKTMDTRKIR